jgi:hypothetical protein
LPPPPSTARQRPPPSPAELHRAPAAPLPERETTSLLPAWTRPLRPGSSGPPAELEGGSRSGYGAAPAFPCTRRIQRRRI